MRNCVQGTCGECGLTAAIAGVESNFALHLNDNFGNRIPGSIDAAEFPIVAGLVNLYNNLTDASTAVVERGIEDVAASLVPTIARGVGSMPPEGSRASRSASSVGSRASGLVGGAKRFTGRPSRSQRNLVQFHLIELPRISGSAARTKRKTLCARGPLTSTLANMSKSTP